MVLVWGLTHFKYFKVTQKFQKRGILTHLVKNYLSTIYTHYPKLSKYFVPDYDIIRYLHFYYEFFKILHGYDENLWPSEKRSVSSLQKKDEGRCSDHGFER